MLFRSAILTSLLFLFSVSQASAETYRIAWTIYAGSMPLAYAQQSGILKKWGDRYGLDIEAVQMNDYIEAQTQFAAGQFAGSIAMTLDLLTIPAGSGMDTTVVMPLSTSAGADGVIVRGRNSKVADLRGKSVHLVELSGSHYLLVRTLAGAGMSEKDVNIINTSDSDIASAFSDPDAGAVVTWKPQLTQILQQYPDSSLVADSADIHGEIVDGLAVRSDLLAEKPDLGKALAGAWYEVLAMMSPDHPEHDKFMQYMAETLNTTPADLKDQLSGIEFFTPQSALDYIRSDSFSHTMTAMTQFAFDHGLLGEGAPDAGYIGVETGTGAILGNKNNVQLHFSPLWLKEENR